MELTIVQLAVIGAIASIMAQLLKYVAAKFGVVLSKSPVTFIVLGLSIVLAYVWLAPTLTIPPDPMEAVVYVMNQAVSVVGAAMIIYNVLLDKVLKALDIQAVNFLPTEG